MEYQVTMGRLSSAVQFQASLIAEAAELNAMCLLQFVVPPTSVTVDLKRKSNSALPREPLKVVWGLSLAYCFQSYSALVTLKSLHLIFPLGTLQSTQWFLTPVNQRWSTAVIFKGSTDWWTTGMAEPMKAECLVNTVSCPNSLG